MFPSIPCCPKTNLFITLKLLKRLPIITSNKTPSRCLFDNGLEFIYQIFARTPSAMRFSCTNSAFLLTFIHSNIMLFSHKKTSGC